MEGGEITWAETFGSASPTADIPIAADTLFQIGSTTKQLTAMAVLTQVDRGAYTLDSTLAEVLPRLSLAADPEWVSQVTVRDLLSHQSGLVDDVQFTGTTEDRGLADFYYSEFPGDAWVMNPPGAFWNYSNPNFDLAGLILEEHDPFGRTYPEIVAHDLLAPLGMSRSFMRVSEAEAAGNYAESFGTHPDDFRLGTFPDIALGEPQPLTIEEVPDVASQRPSGGSTYSTPSDMCRWGDFLIHGDRTIISDETRAELGRAVVPTQWDAHAAYGLGVFVWDAFPLSGDTFFAAEHHPLLVWEHGGNTLSFTSSLLVVPERDVVLSILSNGAGSTHAATQEALLRAVLAPLPEPAPVGEPRVDPAALAALVGRYFDPDVAGEIVITEGGPEGLQIAIPEFERRGFTVDPNLTASTTYTWFATIGELPIDVTFIVDAEGALTPWLRTRFFAAERVAGE